LSKKVVDLENDLSEVKGDPLGLDLDKLMLDSTPKPNNASQTSVLDADLELDTNFVKRAASISLLDKMKRLYRRTCNQG
jgi:hypothetical protein